MLLRIFLLPFLFIAFAKSDREIPNSIEAAKELHKRLLQGQNPSCWQPMSSELMGKLKTVIGNPVKAYYQSVKIKVPWDDVLSVADGERCKGKGFYVQFTPGVRKQNGLEAEDGNGPCAATFYIIMENGKPVMRLLMADCFYLGENYFNSGVITPSSG